MFFKNLTFFRFAPSLRSAFAEFDARLAECALKPVGPMELTSRGFIAPMGREETALSHRLVDNRLGDCIWVTVGGEEKILPAVVVNEIVHKKLAQIEEADGRKLGGRARKQLKDDIVMELLPRAFVRPLRTDAYLDLQHGFIAIDTSSQKGAESLVSEVRHALGSFPALPLNAEVSPRAILTGWIAGQPLPDGLTLGDECELKDTAEHGAIVKCQRQELTSDEIAKHLESGKQCTKLALILDDHVSFVLGEDLIVRKLKFLDGVVDQLDDGDGQSLHAELEARFALMAGEIKRLFTTLETALKLSRAE